MIANDLLVRAETPRDRGAVFELNAEAFGGRTEARLVESLRRTAQPLVSLVAVLDERTVGHALFTPVTVEGAPDAGLLMALGPMAVSPDRQRRGIGGALVEHGVASCRELGAGAVFVLGHAEYYPRFGFRSASDRGLHYESSRYDPYFMVRELRRGALADLSGWVRYLPQFSGA